MRQEEMQAEEGEEGEEDNDKEEEEEEEEEEEDDEDENEDEDKDEKLIFQTKYENDGKCTRCNYQNKVIGTKGLITNMKLYSCKGCGYFFSTSAILCINLPKDE
jgi:hypothetical protein